MLNVQSMTSWLLIHDHGMILSTVNLQTSKDYLHGQGSSSFVLDARTFKDPSKKLIFEHLYQLNVLININFYVDHKLSKLIRIEFQLDKLSIFIALVFESQKLCKFRRKLYAIRNYFVQEYIFQILNNYYTSFYVCKVN